MSDRQAHTPYHPQWHRARPSTYWWLERPAYFAFILREVSSVFVAWFVAVSREADVGARARIGVVRGVPALVEPSDWSSR